MSSIRFGFFAILMVLFAGAAQAAPTATLDRNPIQFGETVQLVIELDEQTSVNNLDLSALAADFEVLGRSTSSQINIVNGRQTASTRLLLQLDPRRPGRLKIPPIRIGGETTNALELDVRESVNDNGALREVFIEMSASPKQAYVQAPINLSVRLFIAPTVNLISGNLSDPESTQANIERLGEDVRFSTTRNGVRFSVIERRYVVYPQASGNITINPVQFRGEAEEPGQRGFGSLFGGGRRVGARGSGLTLDIRPPETGFSGKTWLPAHNIEMTESWPDNASGFMVGKPVTRTVRIVAEGLTGQQIPDLLVPEGENIRHYPDKPSIETRSTREHLVGIREQRIALVPASPGRLELPGMALKWWDIDENREKIARIPPRTIEVAAAEIPSTTAPPADFAESEPQAVEVQTDSGWWPWLTGFCLLGWLATLGLWLWRPRQRANPQKSDRPAVSTFDASRLKKSLMESDPGAARRELLVWVGSRWPDQKTPGLSALALRLDDGALKTELEALERACYGDGIPKTWSGDELWRLLKPLLRNRDKTVRDQDNALPTLYSETV